MKRRDFLVEPRPSERRRSWPVGQGDADARAGRDGSGSAGTGGQAQGGGGRGRGPAAVPPAKLARISLMTLNFNPYIRDPGNAAPGRRTRR